MKVCDSFSGIGRVDLVFRLFSKEDVPEWTKYLDQYLNVKNKSE